MIGSPERVEKILIEKTVSFGQKWPSFGQKWPNFGHLRIPWHIEYDFLKENHMHNFHTKNQEVSQQRLEVIGQKLSEVSFFGQKWPNFGHKWPNFGHFRIFPDHTPTFSERVPQNQSPEQKSRKFIAAFGKYRPKRLKIVNFGPNLTIFRHFGGQKIF